MVASDGGVRLGECHFVVLSGLPNGCAGRKGAGGYARRQWGEGHRAATAMGNVIASVTPATSADLARRAA